MGARETALNVLIACRKNGAWSNGVLKEYAARDGLDRREAALATRLCYGVLQNRGKLDFYLAQLLTGKLKDLHPALRDILHLGLYQMYEMDKIPQSAAVNESVGLAKKYCKRQKFAPGLVNAVLRNAQRKGETLQQPVELKDKYSHPQKLIDLLADYVGQENIENVLKSHNAAPDTVVQVNINRISAQELLERLEQEGVSCKAHPWLANCLVLSGTGNLERLSTFREGLFYVQDAAARLSVACAGPTGMERVLDCCGAPGGKSFAAALEGAKHIFTCDVHPHKTDLIAEGAKRLGMDNITVQLQDATVLRKDWVDTMDCVIADVPCSGYGIIRKKPDIRYKDPDDMAQLPQLQLQILETVSQYVKPGGILMYSTCTLVRRENEDVVAAFLEKHPEFSTVPLRLPDCFPENTTGMLALISGEYDTDGFFICKLRRNS